MTFAHPSVLALLALVVPGLALFFILAWRTRRRLISQFVPSRLQATLTVGLSPRRARTRAILLIAAAAALLVALARPRYGAGVVEVNQRGLDILIAIDTSRSMLAEDAGPGLSRLQRAKLAALDLAGAASSDRLGLIAFAGTSFLQCPLTIDEEAFRQSVEALDTEIIPHGGSSLASAIRTALDAYDQDQANVPVLVLLTDGEEHEPGAIEAADRAAQAGLRIFTVGVGTARGEIIQIRDSEGTSSYLKDQEGNVVKSSLNESLLQEVAQRTHGLYLPLQGARIMAELYERGLAPLPRADLAARRIEQFHERFQWPLALALVLLGIETVFPEQGRLRGRVRAIRLSHPTLAGTSRAAAILVAILLAAGSGLSTLASPGSALGEYRRGNYEAALDEFERLSREHPDDARLRFNAGAAAYRAGKLDRATQYFSEALRSPDLQLQKNAFYNLGHAQFTQGDAVGDMDSRARLWEKSIQSFEAALGLSPQDTNAQHNLQFVRKRLEQLQQQRQQQQQNQQSDPNSKDNPDQESDPNSSSPQDNQDPKQQPGQEPDQNSQQDSNQDASQGQNPQSEQNQSGDSQDAENQQQPTPGSESPKPSDDRQDPSRTNRKDSESSDPQKPGAASSEAADGASADQTQPQDAKHAMTPQQAMRLLDAARGEEKPVPLQKRRARSRVLKDW